MAKESPDTTNQRPFDFDTQLNKLYWGNLRDFHRRFVRHNVTDGVTHSEFFCGKLRTAVSESHFLKCGLTHEVLRVAEEVWNEIQAWRGADPEDKEHSEESSENEESSEEEVLGIGLPSDKPRARSVERLFMANKILGLKYNDDELINYASTVLWTWWIIHKRKDLDQRPESIDVPIRAALLRMLHRGVSTTLDNYEHELRGLDKKDPKYLTIKRKLAAFKQRWTLVVNPPKPVEELLDDELLLDEDTVDSTNVGQQ